MRYLITLLIVCSITYSKNINIAAAANVAYAIKSVINTYKKEHQNINISLNIGSSGKLSAQILQNAPYDIFLSANREYPQKLFEKKFGIENPKVYVKGLLALFTNKNIDISSGLDSLLNPKISKIAIANDKTAPYGVATKEALSKRDLYKRLKDKFIFGESIGQTLIFTQKAADVGVVAKSLLYSKELSKYKEGKEFTEINKSLYKPIEQSALLLSNDKDAKDFYDFLFSPKAKEIFKNYGYIVE